MTRTKGLLSRTRVKDFYQRRLSATHVNDFLCYATLRDTALRYATLRCATSSYAKPRYTSYASYAMLPYAMLPYATLR